MSRRRNGTNRAAAALSLSMYGPMNTGKRKRPKGVAAPGAGLNKKDMVQVYQKSEEKTSE